MKRLNINYIIMGIIAQLLFHSISWAEDMTNSAVFHRCYAQVTQKRVPLDSALLAQVKAGQKDPITACLEVLDSAKFISPDFTQINTGLSTAKDVLRTLHILHTSWFDNKEFVAVNQLWKAEGTRAALDITAPASFFTKALFDPNMKLSDVVMTTANLSPQRTIMNPTITQIPNIDYASYQSDFKFAPIGDIVGVYNRSGITMANKADISFTFGGGVLGSQAYMMSTVNASSDFEADGAIRMPRKWARSVFSDLLCRNLPAVRQADGTPYIDTSAAGPFRRSSACVHCHASMDRMSAVVRNFSYLDAVGSEHITGGEFSNTIFTVGGPTYTPLTSTGTWLSQGTTDFARMSPANGVLFYRSYQGNLIETNVADIKDLGLKISQSDDFYICAAKRYYEYFMGVSADISDLGDPAHTITLSVAEQKHRDIVINLGLSLKTNQSLRQTVEAILRMPNYKKSNFNRGSP